MTKKAGWNGESQRHSLAKKGIKTIKSKPRNKITLPDFNNAKIVMIRKSYSKDEIPQKINNLDKHSFLTLPSIVYMSKSEYDTLYTLEPLLPSLEDKVSGYEISSWGYASGFIATDGNRWLLIDTQGYDYPRYKSPLIINGKPLNY